MTLREVPQHLLHRLSPELCFSPLASPVVPGLPRAGEINVSSNPQLLSGAARDSEGKS